MGKPFLSPFKINEEENDHVLELQIDCDFVAGSPYIAQVDLEFPMWLSQPPIFWEYKCKVFQVPL